LVFLEGDLGVLLDIDLGPALADRHHAAHALALGDLAEDKHPDAEEQQHRQNPGQQLAEPCALDGAGVFDPVFGQFGGDVLVDPGGDERGLAVLRVSVIAAQLLRADHDAGDLATFQMALEGAVGDALDGAGALPQGLQHHYGEHREDGVPQVELVLALDGHSRSFPETISGSLTRI
jgi:hypothetical protein